MSIRKNSIPTFCSDPLPVDRYCFSLGNVGAGEGEQGSRYSDPSDILMQEQGRGGNRNYRHNIDVHACFYRSKDSDHPVPYDKTECRGSQT